MKGKITATSEKIVAGGKTSYSYKIQTDTGEETWVSSLKEYPVEKGDIVDFTTVKKGNFTNLQSLEVLPDTSGKTLPSERPNTGVMQATVSSFSPKSPDAQKIISRQFLMNFTVSLMTFAAANNLTTDEAREHFEGEFVKSENFLYNNAPVSSKEVEKIVDNNLLDDQLKKVLAGSKKK